MCIVHKVKRPNWHMSFIIISIILYLLSQVWPGGVYYPDYSNPITEVWWTAEVKDFLNRLNYTGLWIVSSNIHTLVVYEVVLLQWSSKFGVIFNRLLKFELVFKIITIIIEFITVVKGNVLIIIGF